MRCPERFRDYAQDSYLCVEKVNGSQIVELNFESGERVHLDKRQILRLVSLLAELASDLD